jgi:hypothetical protein
MIAFCRQSHHMEFMIQRATKRPEGFKKPAHWTNEPAPEPQAAENKGGEDPDGLSPTRYGDWVIKGIAVDF